MAVAIGIVLMLVSHAWTVSSSVRSLDQTNKEIAQQWSMLVVEHAVLTDDGTRALVWISNPGRYELVLLRCVVYPKGSPPPAGGFREVGRVPPAMVQVRLLTCPVHGRGSSYVVEVFALPTHLYMPDNPVANAQYGVTIRYDLKG
ncbi:MAG: hypothetical protein QXP43_01230 [Nitrososphaerota archaeon]|nr:hypothetical protein [Candidatus Calditenuis fumarioli]